MENHNRLLLEGLAARGHEITVISTRHPKGTAYEERGNLRLYYLSATKFGSARNKWLKESLKKFLALHEINRFDVICSQQPIFPPIPTDLRHNIPIITLIQGHGPWVALSEISQFLTVRRNFSGLARVLLSCLYHYLRWEIPNFWKSDVIVPPSDEVARSLRWWFLIKLDKIKTIYNGVDTTLFKPDINAKQRMLERYPQLSDKRILLFLSHVTRQKGLHLLIKTYPSLLKEKSNLVLMVVGGGDYLEEAKKMSIQQGVSDYTIFTGMVDIASIPDYINAADIFILPTLRREGLPLSILEVMACKKPVITTSIGGNTSVIKAGFNGILIPPGNISQLQHTIKRLLNDEELAHRLANKGYESVIEKFRSDIMIDHYEQILKKQVSINPLP